MVELGDQVLQRGERIVGGDAGEERGAAEFERAFDDKAVGGCATGIAIEGDLDAVDMDVVREEPRGQFERGGAEIFDPEVRRKIAGGKAPAHQWLEIHEIAHRLGLSSNATMLYGHVEEYSHRVDHMARLRDLQDRTGGFMSFIPLRYRNENNALSHLPEVTPEQDLRNFAVARLFLDNIPHLKAYWVMLGVPVATRALDWGVDDLDGTVDDSTKIYSMAGAEEKSPALTSARLQEIIRSRGRTPVERDSLYRPVEG